MAFIHKQTSKRISAGLAIISCLFFLALLPACSTDAAPSIVISDVRLLAPLTGSSASVAYFKIENLTNQAVSIARINSPQFSKIEIHETSIVNGVSRMRPLQALAVAPGANEVFAPGGKHVMLMQPSMGVTVGTSVVLEFELGDELLLVNATLQSRLPAN